MQNFLIPILESKFKNKYKDKLVELENEDYIQTLNDDELIVEYLLNHKISKDEIYKELENYYAVTFIDLDYEKIDNLTIKHFIGQNIEEDGTILMDIDAKNKEYVFATSEIFNSSVTDRIEKICALSNNHKAVFYGALDYQVRKRYREYYREETNEVIEEADSNFLGMQFLNDLISTAILKNASDIHIETREETVVTRLRIDGALTETKTVVLTPSQVSALLVSVKIKAGLDIAESKRPQDGRIEGFTIPERPKEVYDLRVSTVRRITGEKVVMRLLRKTEEELSFENLGFYKDEILKLRNILHHANGVVFLAGSTGSGKSTTLFTMIQDINNEKINIYTIENPVERVEDTINQIEINEKAGITYASTLKALLRQDPDVIVVGEIRDQETLNLGIEASLTGHYVLTTIHANNAIDTIARLYNMGTDKYLISTSTLAFLSQRLVKVLCPHCREKTVLKGLEREWVMENIKDKDILKQLLDGVYKAHEEGCEHCHNGYQGRTAIMEICEVTERLRTAIAKGENTGELRKIALEEGYEPLEVVGLKRVLEGKTTVSELIRTI